MSKLFFIAGIVLLLPAIAFGQSRQNFAVIAYYAGSDTAQIDRFPIEKLTHIIFSFCHLKGNRLHVDNGRDSAMIRKMISLKNRNPGLKVLLSLGGWGGCASCSDVFASKRGRKEFAASVKQVSEYFGTDGLDLDWEYPAIEGYPRHRYRASDRQHFTRLVKQVRKTLGAPYVLSFAAGGFDQYIDHSVNWKKVMKQVDYVNLMTYDLVNGYATNTGHHTPLYSTGQQKQSIDNAVQKLIARKVNRSKIIIGAAFYGRMWQAVPDTNAGLYQPGKFLQSVSYNQFPGKLSADSGFVYHWDEAASAPFLYNPAQHLFVTYDDQRSVRLKTQYALDNTLGGIMFWELTEDFYTNGLLHAIKDSINKQTRHAPGAGR